MAEVFSHQVYSNDSAVGSMDDLETLTVRLPGCNKCQNSPYRKHEVSRLGSLGRKLGKEYMILYIETMLINVFLRTSDILV